MNDTSITTSAEGLARAFHEAYERFAPEHGYKTRRASAVPWDEVPTQNRDLMVHVCADLLSRAPASGWYRLGLALVAEDILPVGAADRWQLPLERALAAALATDAPQRRP